ncbi:hypothetical protein BgramDRAFT_6703 [Paraburkholderia graminis C4D1M]|uniref:Uncharacterized protein n=1 Tax=Paraburkholderia graminis (strain ATCC 700544 / DSM 17151 / LMG 18924 / NCIMB 13744 / C4D1M) TaxID=396598 RepID=B1GBG6_PARG4|nr:hypothetical protein BgramDRAFT_6703 [Paraburkholderia graminis C4D1M]
MRMNAERHPLIELFAVRGQHRLVAVQLLRRDDVVGQARDFGDRQNAAAAVRKPPDLHDEVDRVGDLTAQARLGALEAREARQHFEPVQTLARRACVNGAHRAVVARVHRLEHFEHFAAPHFADDDAVRAHAQRIAQQVADRHDARAVEAARTAFEPHHMWMVQRQFGRVLDRHDTLRLGDVKGERVEQRRLARTRSARHQHIAARHDRGFEQRADFGAIGAVAEQIVGTQRVLAKLADRHDRPVDRQRLDHHVDASAVRQARIDHRIRFVQTPADRRENAPHDAQQMRVVGEAHRYLREDAVARHVHVVIAVDQDVFDGRIVEQILDRSETRELFGQRVGNRAHLGLVDRHAPQPHEAVHLQIDELIDRVARPAAELRAEFLDTREQMFVRGVLDVLELLALRKRRRVVGEFDFFCHRL